jgi:hypothetical protein
MIDVSAGEKRLPSTKAIMSSFWNDKFLERLVGNCSLYESKCKEDNMPALNLPLIECLVKAFKTHRATIHFDAGFVNVFVKVLQGVIANS